jgi:modulator of FtsH protease HflC
VLLILVVVAYSTFFTVYQTRQALVVRHGQPVRVVTELNRLAADVVASPRA